jgi:glycosyltransferase involved in cell wall biosynthesis
VRWLVKEPVMPGEEETDVIHLHNLHPDYFNVFALPGLSRRKRVVWTLHDMWAFTGHCGYSLECSRWLSGCGRCPHLDVHPAVPRDLTAIEWRLKRCAYKRVALSVAAPSRWLLSQATQSILKPRKVALIPYCLDTDIYRPSNGGAARKRLGISDHAFVALWAGFDFSEPRKGGARIASALALLPPKVARETVLVTMGKKPSVSATGHQVRTVHAGYISSDAEKAEIYSAANVFLFASQADNFPVVVQESLACGTPVLAFDVGGVSELVAHEKNGCLVPDGDVAGFAAGIAWMAEDEAKRRSLGARASSIARERFGIEIQAQNYIEQLYL